MQIKSKNENKLLGRTEVVAEVTYSKATPSRDAIRKEMATQLKSKPELVIIKRIETKYGSGTATIEANVYDKSESISSTEGKHMQKRHEVKKAEGEEATDAPAATPAEQKPAQEGGEASAEPQAKEEAAKEDAPAEEKAEEAPKEEPKEEAKPDEKKEEKDSQEETKSETPKEEEKAEEESDEKK